MYHTHTQETAMTISSSWSSNVVEFDYRGVVLSLRVFDGTVKPGDKVRLMNSGAEYEVIEVGVNSPKPIKRDFLMADEM